MKSKTFLIFGVKEDIKIIFELVEQVALMGHLVLVYSFPVQDRDINKIKFDPLFYTQIHNTDGIIVVDNKQVKQINDSIKNYAISHNILVFQHKKDFIPQTMYRAIINGQTIITENKRALKTELKKGHRKKQIEKVTLSNFAYLVTPGLNGL